MQIFDAELGHGLRRSETKLSKTLVPIGAVLVNPQVTTTSSKGRYVLRGDLAALFDTPESRPPPKTSRLTLLNSRRRDAKITGTADDRPQLRKLMVALSHGDVVIIPAVDRLSRDTTDLLVIARKMQSRGAGIRPLAEPFLDTTSDFAEIVFAILGVAAKLERRRILERTARGRADAKVKSVNSDASRS